MPKRSVLIRIGQIAALAAVAAVFVVVVVVGGDDDGVPEPPRGEMRMFEGIEDWYLAVEETIDTFGPPRVFVRPGTVIEDDGETQPPPVQLKLREYGRTDISYVVSVLFPEHDFSDPLDGGWYMAALSLPTLADGEYGFEMIGVKDGSSLVRGSVTVANPEEIEGINIQHSEAEQLTRDAFGSPGVFFPCHAEQYSESSGSWFVTCDQGDDIATYQVDAETGQVTQVEIVPLDDL